MPQRRKKSLFELFAESHRLRGQSRKLKQMIETLSDKVGRLKEPQRIRPHGRGID